MKLKYKKIIENLSLGILILTIIGILWGISTERILVNSTFSIVKLILFLIGSISILLISLFLTFNIKLDKLIENEFKDHALAHKTPKKVYRACTNACYEALDNKDKDQMLIIRHGALHIGTEKLSKLKTDYAFLDFDKAINTLIRKSSASTLEVRAILLITNEDRLNYIIKKLENNNFSKGENFTVKVFLPPFSTPHISPLILGEDKCFLGFDASSEYRVQKAIQINGIESIKLLIEYFDSIWNSDENFKIRAANILDYSKIEEIRKLLRLKEHNI